MIHVLVRGVVILEESVLLVRSSVDGNTFLPGGHVERGEPMHDALVREVAEEMGQRAEVGRYLGAVEHRFGTGEAEQHEVNHLFAMQLPDVELKRAPKSTEAHLEFFWVPIGHLHDQALRPEPAIDLIRRLSQGESEAFWGSSMKAP